MSRVLPKKSPIVPRTGWVKAYGNVNALDNSAAVFTSTPTSAAIFGMTGSTARENSVEAKITRLTTLRTGGMAALSTFHR
jgi:hypothetical protein